MVGVTASEAHLPLNLSRKQQTPVKRIEIQPIFKLERNTLPPFLKLLYCALNLNRIDPNLAPKVGFLKRLPRQLNC